MKKEIIDVVALLAVGDEKALREVQCPYPDTIEELTAIINAVTDREHDYGTCVYAMSIAAEAAFNYVAGKEGCTGFQASMADLDMVRRTRLLKGPFALIDGGDLLYPQYDIREKVNSLIEKWQPWAKEQAEKLLAEPREFPPHPDVAAHWQKLAEGK